MYIGEPCLSDDILNKNEKNDMNIVQNLLCENSSIPLQRSASMKIQGELDVGI